MAVLAVLASIYVVKIECWLRISTQLFDLLSDEFEKLLVLKHEQKVLALPLMRPVLGSIRIKYLFDVGIYLDEERSPLV